MDTPAGYAMDAGRYRRGVGIVAAESASDFSGGIGMKITSQKDRDFLARHRALKDEDYSPARGTSNIIDIGIIPSAYGLPGLGGL